MEATMIKCKTCSKTFYDCPSNKRKFCSIRCYRKFQKGKHNSVATEFKKGQNIGSNHSMWKGGRYASKGYIFVYKPKHPFPSKQHHILEHRFIMEKAMGRYLTRKEIVHHINEIKDDNRIENLMLLVNRVYHFWLHKKGFCDPDGIIFDGRHCSSPTVYHSLKNTT